jgi:hypothetical protein
MNRSWVLWVVAVVLTLGSAVWQRMTGPTYPVRVDTEIAGQAVSGKLARSQTIDTPVNIELTAGPELTGEVRWRRWPSDDQWQTVALRREGDRLVGEVPGQAARAAKIDYEVTVRSDDGSAQTFGARLRFKGAVPAAILAVHVFAMFFGMLMSLRAGLEALVRGPGLAWQSLATLLLLGVGGLLLGPIVQKHAFDAYWTGWPVGEDLTDNKLALAVLAWAIAVWRVRAGGRDGRGWAIAAAVVTFVIFVVPHSLHGSTHDWESGEHIQAAAPWSESDERPLAG